jgi:hypothetical protein
MNPTSNSSTLHPLAHRLSERIGYTPGAGRHKRPMRQVAFGGLVGFQRLTFIYLALPFFPRVMDQAHLSTKGHLVPLYGGHLPERIAGLNPHFRKLELVDNLSIILVQPASQAIVADAPALL